MGHQAYLPSAINLLTRRRARKMTTIKIVPDFPGAYGAKVDEWEKQKRTEIALMPKREGYRKPVSPSIPPEAVIWVTLMSAPPPPEGAVLCGSLWPGKGGIFESIMRSPVRQTHCVEAP